MKLTRIIIAAALTFTSIAVHALEIQPYSPQALETAQKSNHPVALHFYADWCPICRAQEKVLNSFKADKTLNLTVLIVNYDKEKQLKRKLNVHSQSTIIVYKGRTETARLAGDTAADKIRATLQSAL